MRLDPSEGSNYYHSSQQGKTSRVSKLRDLYIFFYLTKGEEWKSCTIHTFPA